MLRVIILFCLVPFLFRTLMHAQTTMDQQTVKLLTYSGKAQDFPIWSTRCGDDAVEGTLRITTCDGGVTQCACTNNQWGKQWWEKLQGSEGCIWEEKCIHQGETKQGLVPSGTDSRWNNPHVDETWLWGRRRHRWWSKDLEAFAREISECGEADRGDLVAQLIRLQIEDSENLYSFFIRGQELVQGYRKLGNEAVSDTPF